MDFKSSDFMKMKPVFPIPKRSNGFSIDSLISKDREHGCSPSPSREIPRQSERIDMGSSAFPNGSSVSLAGRLPPLHPALPAHFKNLLLNENLSSSVANPDVAALRTAAWAFTNSALNGVGHMGASVPHLFHAGIHPGLMVPNRDPLSIYPWLMSRQGSGLLGFPYAAAHPESGFLFHPYRKPKRVRTAFSPSQLLKLEHAFEKNHYVVGQERKDLAAKLALTETQVKVWFQNRRTKYKRLKAEDGSDCDDKIDLLDDEDESEDPACSDRHSIAEGATMHT